MEIERRNSISIALALLLSFVVLTSPALSAMSSSHTIYSSGTISTLQPLHVEGRYIKNSLGQIITLTGTNYAYFLDDPNGSWVLPGGGIEWSTWDPIMAEKNLEAMKSWGCNVVRDYTTVQWWVDNTNNFRSHIKDWINMAAEEGIYVIFTFWRNNGTGSQAGIPYLDPGNGYINNQADFVNLWADVADELKAYPNVIFEFWNEPTGNSSIRDGWMNITQQCITAVRNTGSTNLILAQWGMCLAIDFGAYYMGSIWPLDWVTNYPLTDTAGNLAYSTHIYRESFYNSSNGYSQVYSLSDMSWALNTTQVYSVAQQYPLVIGEIGASYWYPVDSVDFTKEMAWFNNTLSLLNQNGISYCAFWWWPLSKYQLFSSANYQPNQAGAILIDKINEKNVP